MDLLDTINSPECLRKKARHELFQVADEVRDLVVKVVSEKGGHFASNLGTVELAVALHFAFETPADRLVWDVGHQSYPHKILTGRRDRLPTIRQKDGLSGFTCRSESPYDHFGAGHASTSISAALGIAEGLRQSGSQSMAIAVIGDGSMTGGLAFEALNNAGHIPARNLVVVLNDNDMSIDPNVGALSKFVNQAVTHPGYNRMRKEMRGLLLSLEEHGVPVVDFASRVRRSIKNFFTPGMLFECFGFRYFGPVNGHDLDALVDTFEFIKREGPGGGPYLVHALTVKGKGYKLAEELPLKYHGVNPFEREHGIVPSAPKRANYQDVFADTLIHLATENPKIIGITAAMPSGTGLNKFQKMFPDRCYDVGIAEAHAVVFAAGLATEGLRPVAAIYSTFLQRAYDQVIHDVALQQLPVVFAIDRAGPVGADGATHQGAFDLSYLRAIPNMVIMAPKDENELAHMLNTAVHHTAGPIALRYPRGEVVGVPMDAELKMIPIGRAELLGADAETLDVLLLGIGSGVQACIETVSLLRREGMRVGLINARFVKPLDEDLISQWIRMSRLVVTVEENTVHGGFGGAVLEMMQTHNLHRAVLRVGMPDFFVEHASPKAQRDLCGLDGPSIARLVLSRLSEIASSTPALHPELYPVALAETLSDRPPLQ